MRALGVCFVHTVLKFSLVRHLVRLGAAWRLLCFVHTVCLVWHLVWLGAAWFEVFFVHTVLKFSLVRHLVRFVPRGPGYGTWLLCCKLLIIAETSPSNWHPAARGGPGDPKTRKITTAPKWQLSVDTY